MLTPVSNQAVRLGSLIVWAERGLIHIIDEDNHGEYNSVFCDEMETRMAALKEMATKKAGDVPIPLGKAGRQGVLKFVAGMEAVIAKARAQGEPFDRTFKADREIRRRKVFQIPQQFQMVARK